MHVAISETEPQALDLGAIEHEDHVHSDACQHEHHHSHASHMPYVREGAKTGRNEPCPCQSGKKYKKCCGVAS